VLVLALFYPPLAGGGVHRVLSFTRHLPAHGWDCTVVCGGEDDYWVRDESLLARVPAATEVLRVRGGSALSAWLRLRGAAGPRAGAGGGRRSGRAFAPLRALADWWLVPDPYAGWSRRARATAAARAARGDVHAVLSSSPPDSAHLAAREVARERGIPWAADFRDPWVGLHFRTPPTLWHRARQAALEARVLEQADLVIAASRTHARELAARANGRPRRLLELPNGYEPAPADPAAGDPAHFRLVFTGTLSLMEDTGTLLEAVERVVRADPKARGELRVDLVGPYDLDWERRARARGLDGLVRFAGPRPHAESRTLQRAADALLLWKPRGAGYRTMVPGKLYEYLDSGRPILALLPEGDEAAEWVARARGWVGPPGAPEPLAAELAARLARWRAEGRAPDARAEGLESRTRAVLAAELARALDSLVERR
jgi:glycosyltransferase involved in cell wall biosynthesis